MDIRRVELGLDWIDVARLAELTKEGLRTVRSGEARNPRPKTRRKIEEALGWETYSFDRILEGGDPIPIPGYKPDLSALKRQPDIATQGDTRILVELRQHLPTYGLDLLREHLDRLRDVANRTGRTLGDVLVAAGLAEPGELASTSPRPRDPLVEQIAADDQIPPAIREKLIEGYLDLRAKIKASLEEHGLTP